MKKTPTAYHFTYNFAYIRVKKSTQNKSGFLIKFDKFAWRS